MNTKHIIKTAGALTAISLTSLNLVSCDGDSDSSVPAVANPTTQVQALASIDSRFIRLNIQSGTGLHASSGTGLVKVSANGQTYTLKKESGNVVDSNGTMTYGSNANRGFLDFNDLVGDFNGRMTLTFTSELSGTYSSIGSKNSTQSGSFTILGN